MTKQEKIREVVELVNNENGLGIETAADLLNASSRTAGKWLRRAKEMGLLERHLDSDGYFFYELTSRGTSFLGQENPNQEEVTEMSNTNNREDITFTLDGDLLDELDGIAQDEDRDINDLVEELLNAGLDYLFDETEDSEEIENRG